MWDEIFLGSLGLTTFSQVVVIILLLKTQRVHYYVRIVDIPLLSVQVLCGNLWVWCMCVANEHSMLNANVHRRACSFWSVWGQYVIGCDAWLTALALRFCDVYAIFCTLTSIRWRQFMGLVIVFSVPMFSVSLWIEGSGRSSLDPASGECLTTSEAQWAILQVMAFKMAMLVGIMVGVQGLPNEFMERHDAIRGMAISVPAALFAAFVAIFGNFDRIVFGFAILVCMNAFFWSIVARTLFMWFRCPEMGKQSYLAITELTIDPLSNYSEAIQDTLFRQHFIGWLKTNATPERVTYQDQSVIDCNPVHMAMAWEAIHAWKNRWDTTDPRNVEKQAEAGRKIIQKYLSLSGGFATYECNLPGNISRQVNTIIDWNPQSLDTAYAFFGYAFEATFFVTYRQSPNVERYYHQMLRRGVTAEEFSGSRRAAKGPIKEYDRVTNNKHGGLV